MKWFGLEELCRSAVAAKLKIDNAPTDAVKCALRDLVEYVLDPLREAWGGPIRVTSGFRCRALNRAVGGVGSSQHLRGEAADITVGSRSGNRRLMALIERLGLPYDQLIDEFGCRWVHVSFRKGHNRRDRLTLGR